MKVLIEFQIVTDFLWNEIRIKENYRSKKVDAERYLHKKSKVRITCSNDFVYILPIYIYIYINCDLSFIPY